MPSRSEEDVEVERAGRRVGSSTIAEIVEGGRLTDDVYGRDELQEEEIVRGARGAKELEGRRTMIAGTIRFLLPTAGERGEVDVKAGCIG